MANIVDTMSKDRVKPEEFTAFIEISKGSKMKYELDEETGLIAVDRILSTSTAYPWNYGLIPLTVAPDGDPLDVLVISSEPIIPGALAKCRPIGIMRMVDSGDQDDKVLAVLGDEPKFGTPVVEGASVDASVVKNGKGKKVVIFKYKPKKGYRLRQGHRQPYTKVEIKKINA